MVLAIGALRIDPPVVLAPMAGVTNVTFRQLCRSYGAGLYVNEMVSARGIVERNERSFHMLQFAADEPIRSVQLFGVDPEVLGAAVRILVDEIGVHHIDINMGCPAAKVTRKGGGAAIPAHPNLLRALLASAVRAAGSVPVTLKMRMGIDDAHLTFVRSGLLAAEVGVAAVALHARTAEQLYSGTAHWDAIGELKAALGSVPVLGNGDIWEAADALAMMRATGCDGVVIGRGCLGRPWLFRDLVQVFAGDEAAPPPKLGEVIPVMRSHAEMLHTHFRGDRGVRNFRKHVAWYLTGYPVGGQTRHRLSRVSTLEELEEELVRLNPDAVLAHNALRAARGHTGGPRRVQLPDGWLTRTEDATPPEGVDELVSGG